MLTKLRWRGKITTFTICSMQITGEFKRKIQTGSDKMFAVHLTVYLFIILNNFRPGGIPARSEKGERLLLFIGIIDILQSYRLKKKLEHTFKSIIHDGVRT